jgi:hypothetical protein
MTHSARRSLLAALAATALAPLLAGPAARASSPAAWAEASRQAASECRFWLGHSGYTVLAQLPIDGTGRLYEPTEEGFKTLWQVRRGTAAAVRQRCTTRRPLFTVP